MIHELLTPYTAHPMPAAFAFFLVLFLLGALLLCATLFLMAQMILRPPRMTDGKAMYCLQRLSPGDLRLNFENENFRVRDGRTGRMLHIAGWWIPQAEARGRCAILIHGYADAKVGAIAWAPMFHELDWNILAIDLRAHGESEGNYSTGGFFERDDVAQVIDELLASRPDETRRVVLFGISLGAAVVAAVAAARKDIAAVILESPITDYRRAVTTHCNSLGLPTGPVIRAAIWLAEILSGARFDQVRTVDMVPRISCPVLAILGGKDELLSESDVASLRRGMGENQMLITPGAGHLSAMPSDPVEYVRHIAKFLEAIP